MRLASEITYLLLDSFLGDRSFEGIKFTSQSSALTLKFRKIQKVGLIDFIFFLFHSRSVTHRRCRLLPMQAQYCTEGVFTLTKIGFFLAFIPFSKY